MAEVVDSLKLDMTDHKHELYKSRVIILWPVWTLLTLCFRDLLRFSMFEVFLWRKLECQLKMRKWPINSLWFWEVEGKNLMVCISNKSPPLRKIISPPLIFSPIFLKLIQLGEGYQAKNFRPGGWKMSKLHTARKMQVATGQVPLCAVPQPTCWCIHSCSSQVPRLLHKAS